MRLEIYLVEHIMCKKKAFRLDGKPNCIHEVFIPDDPLEWPSCNNRKFKVWLIPTAPIARVYQEICDRTLMES